MRILQVVHDFLPKAVAGSEIHTYQLAKELCKRHRIHLFFSVADSNIKRIVKEGFYEGLPFTSVNVIRDSIFIRKNKRVDKAFETVIESFKPDIIHFQHLLWLSTNLVSITRKKNIPAVFTLHDFWLLCPKIHLLDSNLNVCSRIKKFRCLSCVWKSRLRKLEQIEIFKPKTYFYLPKNIVKIVLNIRMRLKVGFHILYLRPKETKKIFKQIDLFTAPSKFIRDLFITYGLPGAKILYSVNGVNTALLKRSGKTLSKKIRFGFMAGTREKKGYPLLIEAVKMLNMDKFALHIWGQFNKNNVKKMQKTYPQLDIKFHGKYERKELGKIFSMIDVLVHPTILRENCPLTILEALATKTPVIASRIGGVPELIEDGINGLLFEPGNVEDLAGKMNMVINQRSLIEKMQKNIKPVKSIEKQSVEIEKIYQELEEKS